MSNREEIQITDLEPSIEGGDDVEYIVQIRGIDASGRPGPWSDELKFTSPQQISSLQSFNYVPGEGGWRLDNDGSFEVNGGTIRGTLESFNYVPDVSGWRLSPTGFAEFGSGIFRGALRIGQNTFNVDPNGDLYIGGTTPQNAPFSVNTNGQILAMDIDAGFITAGTIGANVVYAGTIVASQITSGTINVDRIAAGSITGAKIQDATLTGVKIIDGEIGGVKIADLAISTGKIQNNAVRTAKIRDGDVTNAKIDTLAVGKLTGTTISGFNGNFLSLQALSVTSLLSNMLARGYSVSNSDSFYGTIARVASTLIYDGAPPSTDFGLPVILRREDNVLVVFTSSRRYKTDIQDVTPPDRLLDLRLRSYLPIDGSHGRTIGLIAEEVEDLGLTSLVKYDLDGKPLSVSYDLVGAMLVPHVRDLVERVSALEEGTRAE